MDAQQAQSNDVYLKLVEWLHARRKPLLIGAAAIAVVALAWAIIAWRSAENDASANASFYAIPLETALPSAPHTATELMGVAQSYPGTSAGEYARILAAKDLFMEGKYPEGYREFSGFVDEYPDSPLVPQAKLGLAACLEGEGKTTEAIQKYHEIIMTYPSEQNIVSPAKLTMSRLLEESGQLQMALSSYAELARMAAQNPNDIWAAEARERATLLVTKYPQLMSALTNAAASEAPSGFGLPSMGTPSRGPAQAAPGSAPSGSHNLNTPPPAGAPTNAAGKR
jgi:predicted negative regulator of RcsB-dependent stress response